MPRPAWAVCRAAIAVAALYALVLQALLGGLAVTAPDPTHVLCAANAASDGAPSNPHPAHGHLPCCTLAQALDGASPPLLVLVAIVWTEREAVLVGWRPEVAAAPRAPPGVSASARAPPAA